MSNPEWTEPEDWDADKVAVPRAALRGVMERAKWLMGDDDAVIAVWDALNGPSL